MFPRLLFLAFFVSVAVASADTLVVTNTDDGGPGSLRQAITDANAQTNTSDIVAFNIPGSGVHTITLHSALPEIVGPVKIDGWSQPGFQGAPVVEITAAPGLAADGLRVASIFSTIRGLVVNGFQNGIYVSGGLNNIQGCFIGTDKSGTQAAPNDRGIMIAGGSRNLIGGGGLHEGNVLSGNREAGISFVHRLASGLDVASDKNIVVGNFIGTDRSGGVTLSNAGDGIAFFSGFFGGGPSSHNRIGGTTSGARNIISGNLGNGIQVGDQKSGNSIQGNFIGTAANGVTPLGNSLNGLLLAGGGSIGAPFGPARLDAGNVIAFNSLSGIAVKAQAQNGHLSANSIHDNGKLGIDLDDNGVSPNDSGDADTGANGLQNFPVISGAFASGGNLTIYGNLNSLASTDFVLDFYANSAADNSGFGEGQVFLGQAAVRTDGTGNVAFNVAFPLPAEVASVTATAIQSATSNTSEFSAASSIAAMTPPPPPTSPAVVAPALRPAQLLNLSTRGRVESGQGVLIGGFIVLGTENKKIIVRGIGPSLAGSGVPGPLADPILELHDASGQLLAINDNWRSDQQSEIQNSGLAPSDDLESAIVRTVPPGSYTAIVRGKNDTTGIGLVEVYDLSQATASYLANVSTRGIVGTGDNVIIGGFIAAGSGSGPTTVAIRGLGPSLASFGITNYLADPTIELRNANGMRIQSNNEWADDQSYDDNRASGFAPDNVHEALLLFDLTGGNYTVILSGTSNGTGVGLLEVYNLR